MRSLAPFTVVTLLALGLVGCPNTDPAVFVVSNLSAPSVTLGTPGPFGSLLTGGVTLDLHLGARASGPSTVTLGNVNLLDATTKNPILQSVPVMADKTFPLVVTPDTDVITTFTIQMSTKPVPTATVMAICTASSGVEFEVNLDDSLKGSDPAYSGAIKATCP